MTYHQLLKLAYKKAKAFHKEEEACKLLMMELSKQEPHLFFMNLNQEVEPSFESLYLEKLSLYLEKHIPIQHIIGHAYFYGYPFNVNEHVLIPRKETEELVEHLLYYYDMYFSDQHVRVLDLGTGSGCIGLSLALEEKKMDVTISDISEKALEVANSNKEKLDADAMLVLSDLFHQIEGKFDIIVSNPPYIPETETVEDIVQIEPSVALYGGIYGIDFYDRILKEVSHYLNQPGMICFEHGYQQKEAIKSLAETYLKEPNIIQLKDLQGRDRFTFIGFDHVFKITE